MTRDADGAVDTPQRPLRADAERNRRRVLTVALEVFAERGADASFDEIARRAGVGVGTVYRRFPQREDLLVALFEERFRALIAIADDALEMSSGWAGLLAFCDRALEMQVSDRGLREVMASEGRRLEALKRHVESMTQRVDGLLCRAKDEGTLRPDVEVQDLIVVMGALSAVASQATPQLWRRYLPMVLAGLRADGPLVEPLPLAAPTLEELDDVMHNVCGRRD